MPTENWSRLQTIIPATCAFRSCGIDHGLTTRVNCGLRLSGNQSVQNSIPRIQCHRYPKTFMITTRSWTLISKLEYRLLEIYPPIKDMGRKSNSWLRIYEPYANLDWKAIWQYWREGSPLSTWSEVETREKAASWWRLRVLPWSELLMINIRIDI